MMVNTLLFIMLILSLLPVVFLLDVLVTGKTPLVTTPLKAREILKQKLSLAGEDVFYDLGCGTGKLLSELSHMFPSTTFIGIDSSPFSYLISMIRFRNSRIKNTSIKFGNFFNTDMSYATHIYVWIFPKDMDKLLPKFQEELRKGSVVYALDFRFSNKEPSEVIDLDRNRKLGHTLYIYEF